MLLVRLSRLFAVYPLTYWLIVDVDVLNFALTLEHLENAFYTEGLQKLGEDAFAGAGYPSWVRSRFEQVREHEATHVAALKAALGDVAVQACTYNL